MQTEQRQMQIDAGPLTAEALQWLCDQQAETNRAILAMSTAFALFLRMTDHGTAQRSVPGCMRRAMVEAIDAVAAVDYGSGALEVMKHLLQTPILDHTPRPPDPGSHIKIAAANDPLKVIAA